MKMRRKHTTEGLTNHFLANMFFLRKVIKKWLNIGVVGVGIEGIDLPYEFVITHHARKRMEKRMGHLSKRQYKERVMEAWYNGEIDVEKVGFERGGGPRGFRDFQYRYHGGYIYVFGIRVHRKVVGSQKHLITIYNWHS